MNAVMLSSFHHFCHKLFSLYNTNCDIQIVLVYRYLTQYSIIIWRFVMKKEVNS